MSNLAPKKAVVFLDGDGSIVMGESNVAAVPSAELRRAIQSFRAAVDAAVKTVRAREKVDQVSNEQVQMLTEQLPNEEETTRE